MGREIGMFYEYEGFSEGKGEYYLETLLLFQSLNSINKKLLYKTRYLLYSLTAICLILCIEAENLTSDIFTQ
jgi:hypothetical protein